MSKKEEAKLRTILYVIVLVAVVCALLNVPPELTNSIIEWLVGMFVGSLFSFVAGALVEAFSGDLLKKIALNIEIFGFEFSITAFAVVTFIVKIWLFGW
jgi:hypothetical protein